ncbi:hypothetical protein PIB30_065844 [Stylosanthes scabra]|uniref:Uncharacterized protein n=1 Tax=Stylosanthes scabra TaxID=79078 RepID=A0ABU6UPB0_9FABA|nr:hypothetical protein [Stylosanthes scabra]
MTATLSPRRCSEDGDGVDAADSDAGTTVRGPRRSSDCNSRRGCGERRRRQLMRVLRRATATATDERAEEGDGDGNGNSPGAFDCGVGGGGGGVGFTARERMRGKDLAVFSDGANEGGSSCN